MISFIYTAKNNDGEFVKGQIEAQNESAAAKVLTSKSLFPIDITMKQESGLAVFNRVSLKDKVLFTRQLSATLAAGLPITQALETISEQTSTKALKDIIAKIVGDVEGGMQLSASFSRFPQVFTRIDIALVESGEASGTLDKVLIRLADSIEKDYKMIKKVRSALMYPLFILGVVALVVVLMTVYVMPQMENLYKDFDSKLPAITLMLLGISHFLASYGIFVIFVIVAIGAGLRYYVTTRSGRYLWDSMRLKTPILAPFLRSLYAARFSRTMAGLVGSGVSLLDSLSITASAVGNRVIADVIYEAAQDVKGGKPLSKPLRESEVFSPIVPQMISVGEQTGEMDAMFSNLADYFDDEVDNFVRSITSVLEPFIIVVMGGIVAVILVAVMMPIYNIGKIF